MIRPNEKLYIARKEKRLKQKDLAKILSMSVDSYYRKEKGKADFTQTEMMRLAKIFKCSLNDLFWDDKKDLEIGQHNIERINIELSVNIPREKIIIKNVEYKEHYDF